MTPQREIIEKIRNSFKISSEANESDKEKFQGIIGKLHRSLIKLAEDLYSKETHFVLELIQNADDNEYDHSEPLLKFIIDDENILIQNNEKGFAEKNVKAICDVGQSTKSKNLGYIGEKGIGFKSVFRVTDTPQIFSNGFRFKFKRNDDENNLGYIIPHWIETSPEIIDERLTNILLPLKDEAKAHRIKFQEIEPELLLFLQKLSIIEIYTTSDTSLIRYRKVAEDGFVKITTTQSENRYKLIPKPLQVPETIHEEKRDLKETKLILGFPITEEGSALIDNNQKVFAFLPTRPYGFKFIIQADFLVPTSREDIHKDKKWNKWLRDNIANVFLEAVEEFKENEQLKTTFYNYIPTENDVKDNFFSVAVKQLHRTLVNSECVLTESQKWLKPSKVFRATSEIRSLITNDELKKFFDKEYISTDVENNSDSKILDALGIQVFSTDNLIDCLKDTEWLANKPDEWFVQLYSYLEKQSLGKQRLDRIKKLKVIRLTNNELVSPSAGQRIFFPLNKKQNYGFESRIPFVNKKTLALNNKELAERIEKFLESIDIFKAQPFEIIEEHILLDYQNDENDGWKDREDELLLGYIRYIKDNLNDYEKESDRQLNSYKSQGQPKTDPLEKLKKGIWILYTQESNDNWYSKPENLYLSKEYGDVNNLKFLFSGMEDVNFVHNLYIESSLKTIKENAQKTDDGNKKLKEAIKEEVIKWNKFFTKLGVGTRPKITFTNGKRDHWTSGYSHYKKEIIKYSSATICSILEQNNKDKNYHLLKLLDSNWGYYKTYIKWTDYSFYYEWRHNPVESDWYSKIKNTDWLPATNGTPQKPSKLFINDPNIKNLLGDSVSYLAVNIENQEFIKALSINTSVNVETILEQLKTMVADNCSDKEKFIKFYSFLDNNFVNNEKRIKSAFAENNLIFIPGLIGKYTSVERVLWKDVSKVFGDQRFYLEKYYDSLKNFFIKKLGINEKPVPEDYAKVLIEMTRKDFIDKSDEERILSIYKELDTSLKSSNNEASIIDEDWWDTLIQEPIFWTNKLEFWQNSNDIFVNDDEELYKLFKDKPSIAFLKLPNGYHPKLRRFLNETALPYLSKIVKTLLPAAVDTIFAEELTEKIEQLFPFIIRYLYFHEIDTYEKSKEDERIAKLKNLFCFGVEKLEVNYFLNEESATAQRSHLLDNNELYINLDFLLNYNRIAIEISKIFGSPQGLTDFISVLFLQPDLESIEAYLRDRNIQQLPESEQQSIKEIVLITKAENINPQTPELTADSVDSNTNKQPDPQALANNISEQEKDSSIAQTNEFEEDNSEEDIVEKGLDEVSVQSEPTEAKKVSKAEFTNGNKNLSSVSQYPEEECSPEEAEVRVSEPDLKNPDDFTFSKPEKEISNKEIYDSTDHYDDSSSNYDEPSSKESLSPAEKQDIGRWGEEYSLKHIKEKLLNKYPFSVISETSNGYNVIANKQIVAQIYWLNKGSDISKGYDIKIIEDSRETFVEVKSTKTEAKEIFHISGTQWQLAQLQQDNFYIYRVFNARTTRARLEEIRNPAELLRTGHIIAQSITLKI